MRASIVSLLTPFGIWSLKWQRPFWKAAIKIAPDLPSTMTAGLASHLTLISLHLRGRLLGVKSTSYLTSTQSKERQTHNPGHPVLCSQLLIYGSQSLNLSCVAVVVPFPHTVPHHLLMSAVFMTGSLFLREAPLWLLAATLWSQDNHADLSCMSRPLSLSKTDATASIIILILPPTASRMLTTDTSHNFANEK